MKNLKVLHVEDTLYEVQDRTTRKWWTITSGGHFITSAAGRTVSPESATGRKIVAALTEHLAGTDA